MYTWVVVAHLAHAVVHFLLHAYPCKAQSITLIERVHSLTESTPAQSRCYATHGDWCRKFHEQQGVAWKPLPIANKQCNASCNGVGVCNYDTGLCLCPAGWTGTDCKTPQQRPCTNRLRDSSSKSDTPFGHIDEDGFDLDWTLLGSTKSRCGGWCDADIAACWCGEGKYKRVPPPKGAPPGTPPAQRGRPLIDAFCQPKETKDGKKAFGEVPYSKIYGPKGWCNAENPDWTCPCNIDGLGGPTCDMPVEMFCVNQCSGRGDCYLGFCKCHEGWFGHDCSRQIASAPQNTDSDLEKKPWLKNVAVSPVPSAVPPVNNTMRKRPLIYVYDLDTLYSQKMLQYRIASSWCVHRRFDDFNSSMYIDFWVYAVETLLHESILQSPHRTFDPEEADFFYVPAYSSCYPFPVMGWADFPWFHDPRADPRVMHASNMLLDVKRWLQASFPWWDRRGGKDHIWVFAHDEGACWAPNEITPSIWLTHWGRMDIDHVSNTGFTADNYSMDVFSWRQPEGWRVKIKGHPCYDPNKDLVIPAFKGPNFYRGSPLSGAAPKKRDILLAFKGDVGRHRLPNYSRGIRQRLTQLARTPKWQKHNVVIGSSQEIKMDYSTLLSSAKFCLVAPGDGWSSRAEDSVLHGCVPVVIKDNVHDVFESILEWSSFSVRVAEKDVDKVLDILLAIPDRTLAAMQAHLGKVWHRFRYVSTNLIKTDTANILRQNKMHPHGKDVGALLPHPFVGEPHVDDAFSTILQWLHSRIPATR